MRNGTERSAARDALQNVSDFVRYLLIIIILFNYNYVINIQIDILHLSEYYHHQVQDHIELCQLSYLACIVLLQVECLDHLQVTAL